MTSKHRLCKECQEKEEKLAMECFRKEEEEARKAGKHDDYKCECSKVECSHNITT